MKKLLSIFLVITMLVATCSVVSAKYSDIGGHWAEPEINAWSEYGVISGYDGKFAPDRNMTRGEFAVVLNILMGYQKESANTFADLSEKFYKSPILRLNKAGVMQGYDGFITPESPITREEAAVMICKALGIKTADKMTREFSDVADISSWSKEYMNALVNRGLLNGFDGKLNPKNPITRSEVIKILDNAVYPFLKVGTYTNIKTDKIAVISVGDVVVKSSELKGKIIVTQGAVDGKVSFADSKVESDLVIDNDRTAFIEIKNTTIADKEILNNKAIIAEKEDKKPSGGGGGGGGGSWGGGSGGTTPPSTPDSGVTTHSMTFVAKVPATCTENGTIEHWLCSECGKHFSDEAGNSELTNLSIPATGHTYGEWAFDGEENHKKACHCGDTVTEIHVWNDGVITTPPTESVTGVKTYTCTGCNGTKTTTIPVLGHTHSMTFVTEVPATCTTNGKKEYWLCSGCGNTYKDENGNEEQVNLIISATGHSYDAGVETQAPTCTEEGVKTFTCTVCGDTYTEAIQVLGHDHGEEWTVDIAATCTTVGSESRKCTRCGDKADIREIAVLGHDLGDAEAVDDDNHKKECTRCNYFETAAHTWDEGIITLMPTTETEGERKYTCTACQHPKTEVLNKLKVIKVIFSDGYGEFRDQFEEIELTLDIDGKGSVDASDIPEEGSWVGYEKNVYMPSDYADYEGIHEGIHEINQEYWYRDNGEWKIFDETTILTEDTEVHLLFPSFFMNVALGEGTPIGIETRYNQKSRLLDTIITFLNDTIEKLEAAREATPDLYNEVADLLLGALQNFNFIDNDKYVKTVDMVVEFANYEELQTVTFDEVLEMENGASLASMVNLVGYDVCKDIFDAQREAYCNEHTAGNGIDPVELTLIFNPIDDIFKPIYKAAEEKAIREFDASIRYAENPYLQYLTEDLDMFDELFTEEGEGTAERTGYKMNDIIDYLRYIVKLFIATDDALCWYSEGVESDVINDAVLAKVTAVNDIINEVSTDSQYENIPDNVLEALESLQKINNLFLNIEPVFEGNVDIQAELGKVVDSGELDILAEELKNGQMSGDVETVDDLVEIVKNIAEHGTSYYKVDETLPETYLSKYVLELGGKTFTLIKQLQ